MQVMQASIVTGNTVPSSLSAVASVFVPGLARLAALSEVSNEGSMANGDVDNGVASVSAGEQLQTQQLGDPDVGPVLRLCLQHIEKPDMDQLLAESEATKILWSYWQQLEFHDSVLYRRRIGTK